MINRGATDRAGQADSRLTLLAFLFFLGGVIFAANVLLVRLLQPGQGSSGPVPPAESTPIPAAPTSTPRPLLTATATFAVIVESTATPVPPTPVPTDTPVIVLPTATVVPTDTPAPPLATPTPVGTPVDQVLPLTGRPRSP